MKIELMTKDPATDTIAHYIWDIKDMNIALDYLKDAQWCNYEILIWRLIPDGA